MAKSKRRSAMDIINRAISALCVAVIIFDVGCLGYDYIMRHENRTKNNYYQEAYHKALAESEAIVPPEEATEEPERDELPVENTVNAVPSITAAPAVNPTPVPALRAYVNITSGKLNVRSGPDINSQVIGELQKGQEVIVLNEDNGWYYIAAGRLEGYCKSDYLVIIEIRNEETATPEVESIDEQIVEPETTEYVLQPEFQALYEQNNNLIGWISGGGNLDYPLVWRDNSFYMDHGFDGKKNKNGAIFLDEANAPGLSDDYMLIYGHNMRSGDMFGDLDLYRTHDYLMKNPIFKLHSAWEQEERIYVIFSLFDASMETNYASYIRIRNFPFTSDQIKADFYSELESRSIFKMPVDAVIDDEIIGLVTCSYSEDNGRFLIYARRLRDGETEDNIRALFLNMA